MIKFINLIYSYQIKIFRKKNLLNIILKCENFKDKNLIYYKSGF